MATFIRLVNIYSGGVEVFQLDNVPKYVAISHMWQDRLFEPGSYHGLSTLQEVIAKTFPRVLHCWVDTLCILQDKDEDKTAQIPLMGQIYRSAEVVFVMIGQALNMTQAVIDDMEEALKDLISMDFKNSVRLGGARWRVEPGRTQLLQAWDYISRLTVSDWCTRAWTMQEYALARDIIWLGTDRVPIKIADETLSAIIHFCSVFEFPECESPNRLHVCIAGMVNFRVNALEPGRVMEMMAFRNALLEHDKIYGAMAATGTIIPVDYSQPPEAAWLRWCEETVRQGKLRMALLPTYSIDGHSDEGCIFPAYGARDAASGIPLDGVLPIGPASVMHGAVTMYGRFAGYCEVVKRLPIHSDGKFQIRTPKVQALILFTQGNLDQAYDVVKALGGGNFNEYATTVVAEMLVEHYRDALQVVRDKTYKMFRIRFRDEDHELAWRSYMYWQHESGRWLTRGIPYLVKIEGRGTTVYTVCSSREEMTLGHYQALDFNAKSGMHKFSLMLVTRPNSTSSYHKVAMTSLISPLGSQHFTGNLNHFQPCPAPQLERFEIGGYKCEICSLLKQKLDQASSVEG